MDTMAACWGFLSQRKKTGKDSDFPFQYQKK